MGASLGLNGPHSEMALKKPHPNRKHEAGVQAGAEMLAETVALAYNKQLFFPLRQCRPALLGASLVKAGLLAPQGNELVFILWVEGRDGLRNRTHVGGLKTEILSVVLCTWGTLWASLEYLGFLAV